MVQIRRICEEEAEAVLALWNEASNYSLNNEGEAETLRKFQQCASHPDGFCLVADEDGTLLGLLIASIVQHMWQGTLGEIEEIYVTQTARRRGIGRLLVQQALTELDQRGAGRIDAKVEYDEPQALEFWRSFSWKNIFTMFSSYHWMRGENNV